MKNLEILRAIFAGFALICGYNTGMAKSGDKKSSGNSGGALGFEANLWAAADKMRGHIDALEYKHVCLSLIFLKYISDAFEEKRAQLLFGFSDPKNQWFIKDEPGRKEKMKRLTVTLEEQFAESAKLERTIRKNLISLAVSRE